MIVMKDLDEMSVKEFIRAISIEYESLDEVQVFNYLEKKTGSFEYMKSSALLDEINKCILDYIRGKSDISASYLTRYAYKVLLLRVEGEKEDVKDSDGCVVLDIPDYLCSVFRNNKPVLCKFLERLKVGQKRFTTPIAIDIMALTELKLIEEKFYINLFVNDINTILKNAGYDKSITEKGFSKALREGWCDIKTLDHKNKVKYQEAINVYKEISEK